MHLDKIQGLHDKPSRLFQDYKCATFYCGDVDRQAIFFHQKSGFFQRRLFVQQHVCMFRRGHALDKDSSLSRDEFEQADHVVVSAAGTGHATVDAAIGKLGVNRAIVLTVPHFVAVGHILSTTDMIATVPERFARYCVAPFDLRYSALPLKLPEIGINMFWHSRFHKEPGNQWFRSLVFDHFSD